MNRNYCAAAACALITAAIVLLSRIPAMYINPICAFTAKMALTACAVTACRLPRKAFGILYVIAAPFFAWTMDVIEGQMAVAYALSALALMIILWRVDMNTWLKSALAALAAAAVLTIYSCVLLTVRHERTLYSAAVYSLTRQAWPCLAIFIGAFIGEKLYAKFGKGA